MERSVLNTVLRMLVTLGWLCLATDAMAATYTLSANEKNLPPCSGNWSRSDGNTVYTCSGQVTLASGDVVTASGAVTLRAAGFSLSGATFGISSAPITVQAGSDGITGTGTNSFSASVATSGPLSLSSATIAGSMTASGSIALNGGSVAGAISSVSGSLQLTNVRAGGTVTANSGTITLQGGSVAGLVNSNCCDVTTNGTDLQSGARSGSSSLTITGGTLQGDFSSVNNPARFTNVTLVSGTVVAGAISFTNSTVGSATASVTMTSRHDPITLSSTRVYGDLTAPDYSTVNVSSGSSVYGTCRPNSTPANACRTGPLTVLAWNLDEAGWNGTAGEVKDASGNNLVGTAIAGAATASRNPALAPVNNQGTCRYGSFTASASQYVQAPHNALLNFQDSYTIGVWVKPRTLPASGLMSILSKDENYEFHLRPDGTINWWWQTTNPSATRQFNSTQSIPVGQWSHIALRYTTTDQRIYINGNLAGQASLSGTPVANSDPLQLGWDRLAGRYFDGELDELRLYRGALSNAEISALVTERHACQLVLQCFNDGFGRSSVGSDWAVSSRGATAFTPAIVDNRLRLTPNRGNVATAAALQRLFPGEGNYIQVQFKYYAYNGNGADGIALILSDAKQTPQPGGYGGSLGYAQLNSTSGFAGGWLGIALDEYGNFSSPTENRKGGPGLRKDSVSIRGSGSGLDGYRYLGGTPANLNPGVDSASSTTPAPGHTYRLTIDARNSGQALVTVERDTGSGFTVLPGLESFNIVGRENQVPIPEEMYLSLTGSTGGSNNIHEVDDLQVCASEVRPVGVQIHHFDFAHAGNGLTCNPQEVIVRACLDEACSQLYTDPVTATLLPAEGWVGGRSVTFSGGSVAKTLRITTPQSVTLGVESSTPPLQALSKATCTVAGRTTDCSATPLTFAESGFLFDVPTLTAAKPQADIDFRAVRADASNPQKCVPGFKGGTRTIQFSRAYSDPATGTQPVVVNDSAIGNTAVGVSLAFNDDAVAKLTVRYDDAGLMNLSARYAPTTGDEKGLVMTGTDQFVSKPYGICIQTPIDARTDAAQRCNADTVAGCPRFVAAGDTFPVTMRAVAWQADNEALTAPQLCSGNATTPNFRLNNIALTATRSAPAPGVDGALSSGLYSHALGSSTTIEQGYTEVGIITLSAAPPGYFGQTINGGSSNRIGRFVPAFLEASATATLKPSCGTAFSYQGQPIAFASGSEPALVVTGRNRQGAVTRNYDRGEFWRLSAPAVGTYSSVVGRTGLDSRFARDGTATLAVGGPNDGDGQRTYRWTGETLSYAPPGAPSGDDLPFEARVRQTFSAASLTDADEVCASGSGACPAYTHDFGGSQVRLGRVRLGNAHGSELQGLTLPLTVESWQSVGTAAMFQPETADTCTSVGTPQATNLTGNLSANEFAMAVGPISQGAGQISLSAPGRGNDGTAQIGLPSLASWLQYDWSGSGTRQSPTGLASFGIYQGPPPLIFRREVYR